MIRIVFTNGSVAEFDNIEKIYIEEKTHDENLVIVGELVPIGFGECNKKEETDEDDEFHARANRLSEPPVELYRGEFK